MVAGDVAGIAVLHAPRRMGEDIPDAFAAPVLVDRAFDLIARGRRAPHEVGGKRTVVGGSSVRAYNATRGEQAERRGQQPPARHDQHRGRAAPAGAHGREGGGIGTKSAGGRAIDRSGDDWAARGVRLMIARRRHASSKPARARTSKPRRGRYSRSLKFGAPGEIRTHDLCLGAGWRARRPISESQRVGAAALLWRSSIWRTVVSPRRTIVSPRRSIVARGLSVEPRAWCAAKAVL